MSGRGLMVFDGTAYGHTRPAWVVTVPRLSDFEPAAEGIAFVGADSADEAYIRAFDLFSNDRRIGPGVVMDRATVTIAPAPEGATMADVMLTMMLFNPDALARAEFREMRQYRPN